MKWSASTDASQIDDNLRIATTDVQNERSQLDSSRPKVCRLTDLEDRLDNLCSRSK